ncbi:MAG: hypothetical protein RLZZ546_1452, partial [Bacteroidota bacterium]
AEINNHRMIKHASKGLSLAERRLYNFDPNCKIEINDMLNESHKVMGTRVSIDLQVSNES